MVKSMNNGNTLLYRPVEGRWLAGVAAGLALRLGVTAWIIRIAFALLCFAGGLGLLLYVAGWLLIPGEGETDSIIQGWLETGQARRWVGLIIVAVAVIILADIAWFVRVDLALAVVLIGVGVMLFRGDLGGENRRKAPATSSARTAPATTSQSPETDEEGESPAETPTPPAEPVPSSPRENSVLGRVSVGFAVLALGVLGLLDMVIPGFHPDFHHYVALAVAVIGLGLVVGAWFGRTGGLIVLGLVLVPILLVSRFAAVTDITEFTAGQVHIRPGSVEMVDDSYELGAGELIIDLRDVDFDGRTVEVDAEVGVGEIRIRLPAGVAADVSGQVGIGTIRVGEREHGGVGVEGDFLLEGPEGMLVLDAEVGIGQIVVTSRSVDFDYRSQHEERSGSGLYEEHSTIEEGP